ncbi:MAG: serine protease [Acidobacteriota bacterium]
MHRTSRLLCISVLAILSLGAASGLRAQGVTPSTDKRPALPFPPGIVPETICGETTDFQDVELYDGTLGVPKNYVKAYEPTTVQLQWVSDATIAKKLPGYSPGNVGGERWCTGTLIGADLVLTAGHCFDVQDESATGWISPFKLGPDLKPMPAPSAELAKLQVVNFGYQVNAKTGAIRKPTVYPVVALLEHRRGDLDYAIVRIGPGSDGKLPSAKIPAAAVSTSAPVLNELIAVLQHPQGKPKKVEAGHVLKVDSSEVFYDDIDTLGGSSGSGVRDKDGKVIGVHTNGGCTTEGGANRAVTTAAIAQVSDFI